ncbi:MAG: AAA family ATPase [Oligoflexia bacterium]|nr:AAA family ATPase [Oligoflexia bacterium]
MYSSFYNFKIDPFSETPDTRFYFKSGSHVEALKKIIGAIVDGKGFIELTGGVGTGKTMLSRYIIKNFENVINFALLLRPQYEDQKIINSIIEEFGLLNNDLYCNDKTDLTKLIHFFLNSVKDGKKNVILIDEAQILTQTALETIRLISNLECETSKLVQIILFGQEELDNKLQSYSLRQLNQRISTRIHLDNLKLDETINYILYRIEIAEGRNYIGFSKKSMEYIHKVSKGIPRLINQYCNAVLKISEKNKIRFIELELVKDILKNDNILIDKSIFFKHFSFLRDLRV